MKLENNIGWCDETTNAVTGCDKVSPGCKHCYAEAGTRARVLRAQGVETWGTKGERVPVNFEPVLRRLNKLCVCDKCYTSAGYDFIGDDCFYVGPNRVGTCDGKFRRIRLFADSNSDWLDKKWPVETLAKFLDAIRLAPNVDVLLLTKRIENWRDRLDSVLHCQAATGSLGMPESFFEWLESWTDCVDMPERGDIPQNLWLGVSVEDQKRADERIPLLLQTPAAVRFLSVEPLLDPALTVRFYSGTGVENPGVKVDWVIVGGESGKNRRDCGERAIESVVEQCVHASVPVYCKQDSAFLSGQRGRLSAAAWARKEFPR